MDHLPFHDMMPDKLVNSVEWTGITRDEDAHCLCSSAQPTCWLDCSVWGKSLFAITNWYKASAEGNEQVCQSSGCTQPPLPVSQPMLLNPQCYTALSLRFDGVLASWWDEVTSTPQTVLRHRKAVRVKIKPSGFLHPVTQVVINTLRAGCCRSMV